MPKTKRRVIDRVAISKPTEYNTGVANSQLYPVAISKPTEDTEDSIKRINEVDAKVFQVKLLDNPSENDFLYWNRMLEIYFETSKVSENDKLKILLMQAGPMHFKVVSHCKTYTEAILKLQEKFIKRSSQIINRHELSTRKQKPDESVTEYYNALQELGHKIYFKKELTKDEFTQTLIGDAFISGLASRSIRQKLLEDTSDDIRVLLEKALAIETAAKAEATLSKPECEYNVVM